MSDNADMIEETEFTCPGCGGHYFSSSLDDGEDAQNRDAKWTGRCKGASLGWKRGYTRCSFTWPRTDDRLYFRGTGRFEPRVVAGTTVTVLSRK